MSVRSNLSPGVRKLLSQLSLPVLAAPMFLVSGTKLVIEASNAGVVGTFPALNARTPAELDTWLTTIKKEIGGKPYGINLIVHNTNRQLKDQLALVVRHKVPVVITSLGAVPDLVAQIHSYGGLVFHDVTNITHAQKAIDAGVDGIIAVCAGAGGHAGALSPFAFIPQLKRKFPNIAIIGAGAISTGEGVYGALAMGCDLVSLGTRFISTRESTAQQEYKDMVSVGKKSASHHPFVPIVYTDKVSGVNANFLEDSIAKSGFKLSREEMENSSGVNNDKKANKPKFAADGLTHEAKAWRDVWSAGHGIVNINKELTTREVVTQLKSEFDEARGSTDSKVRALVQTLPRASL